MSNSPNEPNICKGCNREDCKGSPDQCRQDQEDSRADYEYEKRRDER